MFTPITIKPKNAAHPVITVSVMTGWGLPEVLVSYANGDVDNVGYLNDEALKHIDNECHMRGLSPLPRYDRKELMAAVTKLQEATSKQDRGYVKNGIILRPTLYPKNQPLPSIANTERGKYVVRYDWAGIDRTEHETLAEALAEAKTAKGRNIEIQNTPDYGHDRKRPSFLRRLFKRGKNAQ